MPVTVMVEMSSQAQGPQAMFTSQAVGSLSDFLNSWQHKRHHYGENPYHHKGLNESKTALADHPNKSRHIQLLI